MMDGVEHGVFEPDLVVRPETMTPLAWQLQQAAALLTKEERLTVHPLIQ